MYTYTDALRLAFVAQDTALHAATVMFEDSQEAYALFMDCGYMLGLAHGGEPVESGAFQRVARRLDEFITNARTQMEV